MLHFNTKLFLYHLYDSCEETSHNYFQPLSLEMDRCNLFMIKTWFLFQCSNFVYIHKVRNENWFKLYFVYLIALWHMIDSIGICYEISFDMSNNPVAILFLMRKLFKIEIFKHSTAKYPVKKPILNIIFETL